MMKVRSIAKLFTKEFFITEGWNLQSDSLLKSISDTLSLIVRRYKETSLCVVWNKWRLRNQSYKVGLTWRMFLRWDWRIGLRRRLIERNLKFWERLSDLSFISLRCLIWNLIMFLKWRNRRLRCLRWKNLKLSLNTHLIFSNSLKSKDSSSDLKR